MTSDPCFCPDCPGGWAEKAPDGSRFIRVCGCPCHEEHEDEDGAAEWQDTHDDTCDCDSCCGDDVEYEDDEPKPMRSTSADESPSAVGDLTAGGPRAGARGVPGNIHLDDSQEKRASE